MGCCSRFFHARWWILSTEAAGTFVARDKRSTDKGNWRLQLSSSSLRCLENQEQILPAVQHPKSITLFDGIVKLHVQHSQWEDFLAVLHDAIRGSRAWSDNEKLYHSRANRPQICSIGLYIYIIHQVHRILLTWSEDKRMLKGCHLQVSKAAPVSVLWSMWSCHLEEHISLGRHGHMSFPGSALMQLQCGHGWRGKKEFFALIETVPGGACKSNLTDRLKVYTCNCVYTIYITILYMHNISQSLKTYLWHWFGG